MGGARGRRMVALTVGCLALAGSACGDDGGEPAAGEAPSTSTTTVSESTTTTTTAAASGPELFDGPVEAFYEVPDPLPPGEPGELIRVQPVAEDAGSVTVRVLYHSRDAQDRDRAVSGIVTYPTAAAPADGWPVVSTANGTVGLASPCALSRAGRPAPTFGVEGVGVVTDYVGMGPVGETHPYLSRASEGNSVIDAVRAARNLPGSGAGDRFLVFGHSQGGHGAQSASELAAERAPELELLGTVSVAPAALFDRTYGGIDDIVSRIVGVMGLYGAAAEHPEIDPADYVGAETASAAAVLEDRCLGDIINAFAPIPGDTFYAADPVLTEPARSIILANDIGNAAFDAPLLLISGTADERVVPERVRDLLERLCGNGQVTEFIEIDGATHDDEVPRALAQIEAFYAGRLAGEAPVDSCP